MTKYRVDLSVSVEVDIRDERVVARCVDNEAEWREHYYDIRTAEQVAEHLAYNHAANSVDDISNLDGWADLPYEAVVFRTSEWEVERVEIMP